MEYRYYDRLINKRTRGRYDVTPVFADPRAFKNLVTDLLRPFKNTRFNKVASLDALGFIIGGAVAIKRKAGFVAVRKGGMLPGVPGTVIREPFVDYSKKKKHFEINRNAVKKGDRVLIVDEWIETGAQARAAIRLIERRGGKVVGIACLCTERNKGTRILFDKYNCRPIHAG